MFYSNFFPFHEVFKSSLNDLWRIEAFPTGITSNKVTSKFTSTVSRSYVIEDDKEKYGVAFELLQFKKEHVKLSFTKVAENKVKLHVYAKTTHPLFKEKTLTEEFYETVSNVDIDSVDASFKDGYLVVTFKRPTTQKSTKVTEVTIK